MGALHAGHVSLLHRARGEGSFVVASIFVNPLQFNDPDDLAAYPRPAEADEALCESAGVDLVWRPVAETIYPVGFDTRVEPGTLATGLEGLLRPGHFGGMATVVLKLLNVVAPDVAIFGRKDFQQLAIVRRMVRDLDVPVRIVACPTVREQDGVAMSSRNAKLSLESRKVARLLSRVIHVAAQAMQSGERADRVRDRALADLSSWSGIDIEYLEIVDRDSLLPVVDERTANAVVLVAAVVGGVRLIDNVEVFPCDERST
jgi:pantoate--beta-alanine ligase